MMRLAFWSIQCAWALHILDLLLRKIPFHKYEYYEQIHDKPVVLQQEAQTGLVVTGYHPHKNGNWLLIDSVVPTLFRVNEKIWGVAQRGLYVFLCFPKAAAKLDRVSLI